MLEFLKFIAAVCIFCPIVGPLTISNDYCTEVRKFSNPPKFIDGIMMLWNLNHDVFSSGRVWGNTFFGIVLWPFEIMSFLWAMLFFVPWRVCKFIFVMLFKAKGE